MTELGMPPKPPLGGWTPAHRFSESQARCLERFADGLIPPSGGFPAPSAVGITGFVERYVTPGAQPARWYPYLVGDDVGRWLDEVSGRVNAAEPDGLEDVLRELEVADPTWFGKLVHVVYQGYYSRPEAIAAINRQLPAGRDYRQTPQPFGYADTIDDWDEDLLGRVTGSYLATEDVVPVALPAAVAGDHELAAGRHDDETADRSEVEPTTTTTKEA